MKGLLRLILGSMISLLFLKCGTRESSEIKFGQIYKTDALFITRLSENTFQHTSFKQTNEFGNVPCNGLVVRDDNEVVVFDTPTDDKSSEELIKWIKDTLHCSIVAVIPTHFHDDCLGGLKAFHERGISSYANFKTIELAKENEYTVPVNSFTDSLTLNVGKQSIQAKFFGEGHSKDNVVGYFRNEQVLFGGCLIKEVDASKGYLGDANLAEWSNTVERVKLMYPDVKIVVPGHGDPGDRKLLDYTINLFRK